MKILARVETRKSSFARRRSTVAAGERIGVCPGVYGAYQHEAAADCRAALRVLQRDQLDADVRAGLISAGVATRICARDDAATK